MLLPLSRAEADALEFLPECGSTNTELVARASAGAEHFTVVATDSQTAGRGRLGRTWVAPPGQTLAVSVLLRPSFGTDAWGWLPLVAGLAMARAVRSVLPTDDDRSVAVKWPNDVLVRGRKVSGLLAEVAPSHDGPAVVLGAGLNLTMPEDTLPTEMATSLTLEGAEADDLLDRAFSVYLRELRELYSVLQEHGGDAERSGIRSLVSKECATLGRRVRVTLPGDETVMALALEIDEAGRLVIERDDQPGTRQIVAAGDVTHVRYE
ncbi:biotin--[acetyl-CoA-carboxylase] ligase [Salinibacterium sp. dk2585]|uniref:biotin--[acetyl-CoA-carboxylase] ligase n=1 Tax=unclassified Salinibacterium TaxID=2632331 RepID=UPI0011C25541|nr:MULTISPECIES: biotin--[acetyl-CoA-carboxylase] ligase [unclassified Salinibacterium]QEE60817.1 biotin--[acetyl-CoA-carboxylase] ligase [Salinibacterium sp. dk2585]TXK55889.1 biotin--[acetyl-CoA-carboxylase] ligase [Salinibacterium sp. dk5596]